MRIPSKRSGEQKQLVPIAGRYLNVRQIATVKGKPGLLPISIATVWRWSAKGTFPKPTKLSDGTTVWELADIEAWQLARKAAAEQELKWNL